MPRILPSQLTDAEILDLLSKEDELWQDDVAEVFDYSDDIVPFLSNYQITPGDSHVSKKLLYKLYKAYSKNPLEQYNFTIQAGKFLRHNQHHFYINIDQFAISKQIYEAEKTKDKTKSLLYQKHFNWFLQENKVSSGRVWVEGFILFHIYRDFCKSRRVKPKLGYVNFHRFLKLQFQFRRLKGNRSLWFRVDQITANTYTEEECEQIRIGRKEAGRSKKESGESTETPQE